ncbi:FliG C-terminal domain-containing protein [Jannaschia marina]|uniref:FliG C-terminal domain-containing protein n=1 Tax=Jannaschia marina TaxID=2741674 RepID=UPI0015C7D16B|nr:FliG C-terminal domain-containing protein [Jannaschia marina]
MSFQPDLPAAGPPARQLTSRQKAAVIVHLLVSGGADPGLRDLPAEQQRQLAHDMAGLRFVDRATLAGVVAEFAEELDSIGLHVPRDPARILALLEPQLSLEVVDGLAADLGDSRLPGDGPWAQVAGLDAEALLALLRDETDEVAAILMSKLPPSRAAELMQALPPDRAEQIAAAFARTETVAPVTIAQIGLALGRETAKIPTPGFETDGVARVAGILNVATSTVRNTILEKLDGTDPDFAARVRQAVFSFENIPDRIAPRDLPKVMKAVEQDDLVIALAGQPPDETAVKEFILGSISKRMAEQIEDEIAERDSPTTEEAEAAMGRIVAVIRALEETGDLILVSPDDDV